MITKAEYIWIDGHIPTSKLRSKTKVIDGAVKDLSDIPDWGFDGSSTQQAEGHFSDCLLKPVSFLPDPIRGGFCKLPQIRQKPQCHCGVGAPIAGRRGSGFTSDLSR